MGWTREAVVKGLGTKTLVLKLGEGKPRASADSLLIRGSIKEPVRWDYTITMTEQDLIDILKVAVRKERVDYLHTVDRPMMALVLVGAACAPVATTPPTATSPAKATAAPPVATAPADQPTAAATKPPAAKEPIKIGLVASFSGYASVIGTPLRDGVVLMEEETNKSGGINGYPVRLIAYDDESDDSKAVLPSSKTGSYLVGGPLDPGNPAAEGGAYAQ